jgi:excisionase family DNA binding protein
MDGSSLTTRDSQPTLDQVRSWPPTVDVEEAATALGVSRGHLYAAIKRGECSVKTIKIGSRIRVLTISLVDHLEGK